VVSRDEADGVLVRQGGRVVTPAVKQQNGSVPLSGLQIMGTKAVYFGPSISCVICHVQCSSCLARTLLY
jgi:hypothetical protein